MTPCRSETSRSPTRGIHPAPHRRRRIGYLHGILKELSAIADGLKGFEGEVASSLPAGAGLSSSAALECGLAYGLNVSAEKFIATENDNYVEIEAVGREIGKIQ